MRIVTAPGRLVRDPATRRPIDDEGLTVDPLDPHWVRLLADGDVEPAPEPAPAGSEETRA